MQHICTVHTAKRPHCCCSLLCITISAKSALMCAFRWLQTIVKLAKLKPWVIRGNASEIMALAGAAGTTRGVDSTAESSEALEMGKQLALDMGSVVAISGKVDFVRLRPAPCLLLRSVCDHSVCPQNSGNGRSNWHHVRC